MTLLDMEGVAPSFGVKTEPRTFLLSDAQNAPASASGRVLSAIVPIGTKCEDGCSLLVVSGVLSRWVYIVRVTSDNRIKSMDQEIEDGQLEPNSFGPNSLCADPTTTNRYFRAYHNMVGLTEGKETRLFVGREKHDAVDGIAGCACTSDGQLVYITDGNRAQLLTINTLTFLITAVAGDRYEAGCSLVLNEPKSPFLFLYRRHLTRDGIGLKCSLNDPQKLTFYRSPNAKPDSVLFIATEKAIRRFDIKSGEMTTLKMKPPNKKYRRFSPSAIACTTKGILIFGCSKTYSLYTVDPTNCEVERIAGSGFSGERDGYGVHMRSACFRTVMDLCMDEPSQRIFVVERKCIRSVTAPDDIF